MGRVSYRDGQTRQDEREGALVLVLLLHPDVLAGRVVLGQLFLDCGVRERRKLLNANKRNVAATGLLARRNQLVEDLTQSSQR